MEITKEILEDLYIVKKIPSIQITKRFNYKSSQTILNALKKFGIPIRNGRQAQYVIEIDKSRLFKLYIECKMSCGKIATILGCSAEVIRRLLIKYKIARRKKTYRFGGHNKGVPSTLKQRQKLSRKRKSMFASGELQHWNKGRSWKLEVRRKISETLLNGREPAPQNYGPDWKLQRTSCLQRDNYKCQQCDVTKNLEVHHWEPYRFCFDNSLDNLVTLCKDCHQEIHKIYRQEGFIREAEEALCA